MNTSKKPDFGRAPRRPSIWGHDEHEDETATARTLLSSPWPAAGHRPNWHEPAAWLTAESRAGRALAEAAATVARLDERLRRMAAPDRSGLSRRLALMQTSDLLWAEGVRARPEVLAMADAGRIGWSGDDTQLWLRAGWAVRRLSGAAAVPETPETVRAFLGLHGAPDMLERMPEDEEVLRDALWLTGLDPEGLGDWCQSLAALDGAHTLTRAAAGFHLWRGFGLSPPERLMEPAVIAARIGAEMGQGGLAAVPVASDRPPALRASGGDAGDRLTAWLAVTTAATQRVLMELDRIEVWADRAARATAALQGPGAPRLIALLRHRPIVSAGFAGAELGLTPRHARRLLRHLETLGLVREITGHSRFRYWRAAL